MHLPGWLSDHAAFCKKSPFSFGHLHFVLIHLCISHWGICLVSFSFYSAGNQPPLRLGLVDGGRVMLGFCFLFISFYPYIGTCTSSLARRRRTMGVGKKSLASRRKLLWPGIFLFEHCVVGCMFPRMRGMAGRGGPDIIPFLVRERAFWLWY